MSSFFPPLALIAALSVLSVTSLRADDGNYQQGLASGVISTADLVSASASVADGVLKLSFSVAADKATQWHHVYFNTDGNGSTGFVHFANPDGGKGMDYMLESNFLYQWSGGDDQRGWHWTKSQQVSMTTTDKTVNYQFPIAFFNLKGETKITILIETSSDNYSQTLDVLPRTGKTWTILVPAAALQESPATAAAFKLVALTPPDPQARARFKKIKSYACYYGSTHLDELTPRDALIVETRNLTPQDVANLKKKGALVTGYISSGEDNKLRVGDGKGPGGYDSCYVDHQHPGVPDMNGSWGSYYVNPGSPTWQAYFLQTARNMEKEYGVDGFFIDTIETVDVYPEFKPGMIAMLHQLRVEHPKAIIILNRGFHVINETVADVDGFMFEDFSAGHYFDSRGYTFNNASSLDGTREQADSVLEPLMKKDGLVVLALDYAASSAEPYLRQTADRARSFGFIPYASTYSLGDIFNTSYQGKPNNKWLHDLSSPEELAVVLPHAANGFPKGTRIIPSSAYADYSVAPLTDGIKDRSKLDWRSEAWASQEKESAHYLEFQFPKTQQPHQLVLNWAVDHGESFPSRTFAVEVKPHAGKDWRQIWHTDDNMTRHCEIPLPGGSITALRVSQPTGGGSTARPNIMWVEQVYLR